MLTNAKAQEVADGLLACPFCGVKLPVICLDNPNNVAAWNTRANWPRTAQ